MTDAFNDAAPTYLPADPWVARRATMIRMAMGLAQGLLLYGLYQADKSKVWPATQRELFAALLLVFLFAPFAVLAGVSALRWRTLAIWTGMVALVAAGLGAYGAWGGDPSARGADGLGPGTFLAVAALTFIGHHLVQPADMERRRIARFPTYFDVTWKHGVQAVLSLGFTGAFWLLLLLAAALFKLIGVDAIDRLIKHEAFAYPATTVMFAAAVQLTDVRANLVRGVRTVSLTLLAWLLPLMALIAAAFLLTLPFTGLEPLWRTKSATVILLVADAFLILLTNAAYQDGTEKTAVVLKWAARLAGVLLVPITVLAAYGLSLRIGQYGLSPDRVIAAACVLVAAGYALGYAVAAVRPGAWMRTLEPTNIAMAFVVIAVLLAVFTPLADPRRLSVNDQVGRLKGGRISADAFDYVALRFDDGRFGREALETLRRDPNPAIKAKATATAKLESRPYQTQLVAAPDSFAKTQIYPKGQVLPKSFVGQTWTVENAPFCADGDVQCRGAMIDTDGDGVAEVLLSAGGAFDVFKVNAAGVWSKVAETSAPCGNQIGKSLETGDIHITPSLPAQDLIVGAQRLRIDPVKRCEPVELTTAPTNKKP